jgi:hypothetical protein
MASMCLKPVAFRATARTLTRISLNEISGTGTSFHRALDPVRFLPRARFTTLEHRVLPVMSAQVRYQANPGMGATISSYSPTHQ